MKIKRKAFTVLELLVVVAIIAILAVVAVPRFIGPIEKSRAARDLAELNSVEKAAKMFYIDNGYYPTLQGAQPTIGDPKNVKFGRDVKGEGIYPKYLRSLPRFSYWYIDYVGTVYHTEESVEGPSTNELNPNLIYDEADKNYYMVKEEGSKEVYPAIDTTKFLGSLVNPEAQVYTATGIKQIGVGSEHVASLMENGTVITWGCNAYGQLGNTLNMSINSTPTLISGLTGVKQISSGDFHTVALMEDGTLMGWGYNANGQLGNITNVGTQDPNPTPTLIPGFTTESNKVIQVCAENSQTIALMADGTVKACGYNHDGQLGNTINNTSSNPNPIPVTIAGLTGVKQISTGDTHVVALLKDGTVMTWGSNLYGQLGNTINSGLGNPNPIPTLVTGLTTESNKVKQISAGYCNTVALMEDGTVKVWGRNRYGLLVNATNISTNNPNPTPTTIPGLNNVKQVEAGSNHIVALMEDGTVKSWGSNLKSQLGYDTNFGTSSPNSTPTTVPDITNVAKISACKETTVALMQDGTLKAWGSNYWGQLGTITNTFTDNANPPTLILGVTEE